MAKTMMKWPLKRQFTTAFALILLLSVAATITTYYLTYVIYGNLLYRDIYPANYYEKQIPHIEAYIHKQGVKLLDVVQLGTLSSVIPSQGIAYQVVDDNANFVYGTDDRKVIADKGQLYQNINNTLRRNGRFVRVVPIIDNNGKITGGVLLSYELSSSFGSATDKLWVIPLFILLLFSPFVYIFIFTLLCSKLLADNINKPLQMLIMAAKKVKEKDLNFNLDYKASNELGQLCEAFHDMKAELETSLLSQWRMEQERLEMVENLAHDIKTPLTLIQGYVDSLLDENTDNKEKWKKYLTIIKENTIRSSNYVQYMQVASDPQHSAFPNHYTSVDITAFLKKKTENYRLLSAQKTIDVLLDIRNERPYEKSSFIDAEKLERILDNIVLNSIRYTPICGKIEVKVRIDNQRISFIICDSGVGFHGKDLANVFTKLYTGTNSTHSRKEGHTGLGLYIAKQLVEMHGGAIKAFNSEQGGACVVFDIMYGDPANFTQESTLNMAP